MSDFEIQQKIVLLALHNAKQEMQLLQKIVEAAEIPQHKNWDLDWSYEDLCKATLRIRKLNDYPYRNVKVLFKTKKP